VEIKKAHHSNACGVPTYLSEQISGRAQRFRRLQKRLDNLLVQSFNTTQRWPPKLGKGGQLRGRLQKMYDSLFNDVTDAISLLQRAQQKTEELFISGNDGVIVELKRDSEPDGSDK
jgi:hypothetical protein